MAKNAMPVSKAKTAYGLLSEIRKLILEEPKRYDQTQWKVDFNKERGRPTPACHTACCIAGWVDTLKSPDPVEASKSWDRTDADGVYLVASRARQMLGLSSGQADTLFSGDAAGRLVRWQGFNRTFHFATHAKWGAAHIAKFQKKYAAQLKAKRV